MGKEMEMSVKPPSATGLLFRATSCVAEPLRYKYLWLYMQLSRAGLIADRQEMRYLDRQRGRLVYRQAGRRALTKRVAGRSASRLVGRRAQLQAGWPTDRQTHLPIDKQIDRSIDRQGLRLAGRTNRPRQKRHRRKNRQANAKRQEI